MADRGDRLTIGNRTVELSNLGKVLFPESGITKGALTEYYRRIAETALPHYRDRPLSMYRFPDGIGKEGFFQKDVPDYFPDWIDRVRLPKDDGTVTYVTANNAATLVYIADQGCITPHLGLARCDRPRHPDRLVFDLDPSDGDFAKIQDAARKLKRVLDALDVTSFVQTTGSRGLHVVVPLDRSAEFEAVRAFSRRVAENLVSRHPETLTTEQRKAKRGDRVFLDYLRNAYGQTAVAPYAVRALEGAPVATPLRWEEALESDRGPRDYTIQYIFRRIAQTADPWADIGQRGCSIEAADRHLDKRG